MGESVGREGEEEEGEEEEEEEEEEEGRGPLVQSHHGSRPPPPRPLNLPLACGDTERIRRQATARQGRRCRTAWSGRPPSGSRAPAASPAVTARRHSRCSTRARATGRHAAGSGRSSTASTPSSAGPTICSATRGWAATQRAAPPSSVQCCASSATAGSAPRAAQSSIRLRGGRRAGASPHGRGYGTWDSTCRARRSTRTASRRSTSRESPNGLGQWVPPRWLCADARELITGGATGGVAGGGSGGAGSSSSAGSSTGSGSSGGGLEGVVPVGRAYDFLFSCPPYYDLERYSDDPNDLSAAPSYEAFLEAYQSIIRASVSRLKPDRFCAFVVGEIRDADGFCRNFVGDTISAFQACGAKLYNSAIMMLPLHSLPMRAAASFNATAKLGMCHQHVLVFYTGKQPNKAVKALGLHNAQRSLEWF